MNLHILGTGVLMLALSLLPRGAAAAPELLYVADPAMNMIYGQPLDGDTTNSLLPISGSVTVVADSVAHLSAREIAFIPSGEARIATLDLETRELKELAAPEAAVDLDLGVGTGPNDFVWLETDWDARTTTLVQATREGGGGEWQLERTAVEIPAGATSYYGSPFYSLFAASPASTAILKNGEQLFLYRKTTGTFQLLNTASDSDILRGPNGEILQFIPGSTKAPVVFDAEGNRVESAAASAPLFASGPQVVEWRADSPQLAGVTRDLGKLLTSDTLDTTATVAIAHATRDENGSVIPERDITGAATLHRISPTRWQFYNETGGMQVIDTATHRTEYQLQFVAGRGPEFAEINAISVGPDEKLYVLDAGRRLFRVDPRTGERELLKTFDAFHLLDFLHVRADGTILLVDLIYPPAVGSKWRLVNVREQAGDWVAEMGTPAIEPPCRVPPDFRPVPDGVRVLLRSDLLTGFSDLTLAGARTVASLRQSVSGLPTLDGQSVLHELTFPSDNPVQVQALTLKWSFDRVQLSSIDFPTGLRLHAPSGRITSLPNTDMRVFDTEGREVHIMNYQVLGSMALSVALPAPESSAGVWKVETILGNVSTERMATVFDQYSHPVAMSQDPLFKASLVAMPQDDSTTITLLGGFPPTLRQTDDRFTTVRSIAVEGDDGLNRLGDAVMSARGAIYASEIGGFKVWRIDPATGSTQGIIDRRPAALDAQLLGRDGSPGLKLAIGPMPEFFAAGGWLVN